MGAPGMGVGPIKPAGYDVDEAVWILHKYADHCEMKHYLVDLKRHPRLRTHPKIAVLLCSPVDKLIHGVGIRIDDTECHVIVDSDDQLVKELGK